MSRARWLSVSCVITFGTPACDPAPSQGSVDPSGDVAFTRKAASPEPDCPTFRPGTPRGRLSSKDIAEASGLVAGRANPGVLWTHNDSGDRARVFALTPTGKLLGVYALPTARAVDWEDLAIGPGKDTDEPHLYIGDIGDNRRARESIFVHRVPEPASVTGEQVATEGELGPSPAERRLGPLETFRLKYPAGPHDAETLLVEPTTGEVVLLTKALFRSSEIYSASALRKPVTHLKGGAKLDDVAPRAARLLPTGGDVSHDGRWVVVRSYGAAYLWSRDPKEPLREAFASTPCVVPLAKETQGEAIGFSGDGRGYFTVSEGLHATLFFYAREP